jgi:hypothetical protein
MSLTEKVDTVFKEVDDGLKRLDRWMMIPVGAVGFFSEWLTVC